ncbi:soluble lytic murein transglycosylase-like protein [Roseovarius sp. MBR-154]
MKRPSHMALVICLMGAVAQAEGAPPFPEFTFKRETAPKPGERRKPLVQIAPEENTAIARPAPRDPVAPQGSRHGWFWEVVPWQIETDPATRLAAATQQLARAPDGKVIAAPRLDAIQRVARDNGAHILRATIGTRVSPALVLAVIAVESSGTPDAVSSAGAQGLMQLMPDTAARFGVADVFEAGDNIRGGVAYLDWLIGEFGGDVLLALAGYNAGENAVKSHAGVPPFAETRDYIPKVLAAYEVARGLCKTRPDLITDACALTLASN